MNELHISSESDTLSYHESYSDDEHDVYLESSTDSPESFDELSQTRSIRLANETLVLSEETQLPTFSEQSFKDTLRTLWLAVLPFCASRLAVSAQGIGYAYLMGQFGSVAISAGPLISGLQNAIVTPIRSGLVAINVVVSGMQQPRRIGRLIQQTYAGTIVLTLPTLAVLLNAGPMLRAMGTDADVATEVQHYMNGYAWGVLPIYGLVIDQQFCLAIGKRGVATIIGLLYAALTLVSGYALTTYIPGQLYQNTYGLGLGFSASAWFMMLSLKLLFGIHPAFQAYQIFHCRHVFKNMIKNIKSLLSLALPLWLQSLSESFNLMAISILMSRISNDDLMAEQVSLQWMTALSAVILAIATVSCSITSKLFGAYIRSVPGATQHTYTMTACESQGLTTGQQILRQLGRQTLASMILAGSVGAIFASLFWAIPRSLTSLFVPSSDNVAQDQRIESLSTSMLHTNSIGLLADSCRITLTGNLLGMRDAMVPATVSFLLISCLGLLIGAVGTELFGFSGDSLFIVRNLFVILATVAIGIRWFIYRDNLSMTSVPSTSTHLPEISYDAQVIDVTVNDSEEGLISADDLPRSHAIMVSRRDVSDISDTALVINGSGDLALQRVSSTPNSGLTQYGSFFREPGGLPERRRQAITSCCIC